MDERPRLNSSEPASDASVEFVLPILSSATARLAHVIPAFFFLHALFFAVSIFRLEGFLLWTVAVLGTMFSVTAAFFSKKMKTTISTGTLIIILCICITITWMTLQQYLLAVTLIFIPLILRFSQRPIAATISVKGVTYPGLQMRTVEWKELSNVILKDGMLTIDRLDNKLVQLLIEDTHLDDIDQGKINQFCADRIRQAITKSNDTVD